MSGSESFKQMVGSTTGTVDTGKRHLANDMTQGVREHDTPPRETSGAVHYSVGFRMAESLSGRPCGRTVL